LLCLIGDETQNLRNCEADVNDGPAILVTGGAGYIGSHCCRALAAAGYHPVVFDNFSTGHRNFVTGSLVVGDLMDKAALARAFAQHEIVAVMHFAATSLVGESVIDPQKYYWNNVVGTLSCSMRCAGPDAIAWCFPRAARSMAMPTAKPCPRASPARRSIPMAPRNG
jgi:UDP-glucose 4-epimerase